MIPSICLPTFCSFSFWQASLWLGFDKVLKKLTKFYKCELRHSFQCCISITWPIIIYLYKLGDKKIQVYWPWKPWLGWRGWWRFLRPDGGANSCCGIDFFLERLRNSSASQSCGGRRTRIVKGIPEIHISFGEFFVRFYIEFFNMEFFYDKIVLSIE